MSSLLHLDSSSRTEGSQSRQVADTFAVAWQLAHPDGTVTYRDLAAEPLPHLIHAVRATDVPEADLTEAQREALAVQNTVIEQFLAADAYLLSVPMYNFGIPSQLKAYLDHLLAVGRVLMVDGTPSPVAGRPATVVVSFGGGYGPGTPRADFDFVRPYLSKVLTDTLGLHVEFITVELTLAPDVPAMAGLVELGEQSRRAAHSLAGTLARATALPMAS